MPILEENIQFVESQVLDDVPEGGGAATGRVVTDTMNNLFDDISDLDRAMGRFNLRKIFVAVRTLSAELFGGAKSVITALPEDDAIGYALFSTGQPFDTRADAANRVESYLFKGPMYSGYLLGDHLTGMRSITLIQQPTTQSPVVGETLTLVQFEGEATQREQYVRVTSVEQQEQQFEDTGGVYIRVVVTLALSAPLLHDFDGHEPERWERNYDLTNRTRVRTTTIADATRYYSARPTTQAAAIGDTSVRADTIFTQLVPAAQSEQALTDLSMAPSKAVMVPASTATMTTSETLTATATGAQHHLPRGAMPGSVSMTWNGNTYSDSGAGELVRASGTSTPERWAIDYASGLISANVTGITSGASAQITFTPAVSYTGKAASNARPVSEINRGYTWQWSLPDAKPRPGSVVVSYLVLGRWYQLEDNGSGVLEGEGTGIVNFATGTVSVTLNALPDVGSVVICNYVVNIVGELATHNGSYPAMIPAIVLQLQARINPNSLSITYTAGGTERTVTDDGAGGLTGDGSGTVDYATGAVRLTPTRLHDDGTTFGTSYVRKTETITEAGDPVTSHQLVGTLASAPVAPGTVEIRTRRKSMDRPTYALRNIRIVDDGNGGWADGYSGSINYATGEFTLEIERSWSRTTYRTVHTYSTEVTYNPSRQ